MESVYIYIYIYVTDHIIVKSEVSTFPIVVISAKLGFCFHYYRTAYDVRK